VTSVFFGGGGEAVSARLAVFTGPLVQSIMGKEHLVDEDLLTTKKNVIS
jgi:hypothetical protein